jgi:predicted metal-dependent hydrolase
LTESERAARDRAIERLRRHAVLLAGAFDLPLRSIEPESERVTARYGICYADGRIRIRLHQVRGTDVLKYSVMVDTLCHELAHLRHFNHGRRFWQFYRRILAYAARQGIYRPGPEAPLAPSTPFHSLPASIQRAAPRPAPGPAQLDLFAKR